jgi:hypothetical protein
MSVPTSEVSYTSATTGRGDHKVHKGHVVALAQEKFVKVVWRRFSKVLPGNEVRQVYVCACTHLNYAFVI